MYQQIDGPDHINTGITYAVISVLPKSGYVGTCIFFNTYAALLAQQSSTVPLKYKVPSLTMFDKTSFKVGHIECPNFKGENDPQIFTLWDELSYSSGIPWNMRLRPVPYPAFTQQNRIVFIYRNPLDQLISHYKHIKSFAPDDRGIDHINLKDLEEFMFHKNGLSAYIKMFYTYHIAKQKHPDHILFVPYEVIMHDRPTAMLRIIRHLDIPYDPTAFNTALELTSITNLKAEEEKMQHSLFASSGKNTARHIRNGGVGVWQQHMTPEMVKNIEIEMQKFGLSLHMFQLTADGTFNPEFSFLAAATPQRSLPKLLHSRQQLRCSFK